MKNLVLIALILVWVFPAAAQTPPYTPYTITPWPYGLIAWVRMPPSNMQEIIDQAVRAVDDVFSLWDQPTPIPAQRWNQLKPMPQGAWNDANYDPFIAGFLPVPSPTSDDVWEIPLPTWGTRKILPLILIVFQDVDLMQQWTGDYTRSASINSWYAKEGIGTGVPLVNNRSLWQLVHRSYSIMYSPRSLSVTDILHHELGHWMFFITCIKEGIDPDAFPPLIREGFAEYTTYPSIRHSYWRFDAAGWVKEHDLSHVPYFMSYPLGASLINAFVARDGADQVLEELPSILQDWDQVIAEITPYWRHRAVNVDVTQSDRAYYEAELEQLYECFTILSPILPSEVGKIVSRLYDHTGSMQDITRFWQIVSTQIERPSGEVWQQMSLGEKEIAEIGSSYEDKDLQDEATTASFRLQDLRVRGKWDGYYDLLIKTLRDVVAHYGTVQKVGAEAEESK